MAASIFEMGIFRSVKRIIILIAFVYLAIYLAPSANKYLDGYLSDYSKDSKERITSYLINDVAMPMVDNIADKIRDNGKQALNDIVVPNAKNVNVSNKRIQ